MEALSLISEAVRRPVVKALNGDAQG